MGLIRKLTESLKKDKIQRVYVGAIIKQDSKVLVKRLSNRFSHHGNVEIIIGEVEALETLVDALYRVVKSETGLTIQSLKSFVNGYDFYAHGKKCRQLNFVIGAYNGDINLNYDKFQESYLINKTGFEEHKITKDTEELINHVLS